MHRPTTVLDNVQTYTTVGIRLIQEGHYEEASKVFTQALTTLYDPSLVSVVVGMVDSSMTMTQHPYQRHVLLGQVPQEQLNDLFTQNFISVWDVPSLAHCHEPSVERGDFFFRPFCFHGSSTTTRKINISTSTTQYNNKTIITREQRNWITIICFFNLALCFHLEWSQRHQGRTKLLTLASYFYREAFSVFITEQQEQMNANFSGVIKVLMAICTNVAFCHYELGEMDHLEQWNDRLFALLLYEPPCPTVSYWYLFCNSQEEALQLHQLHWQASRRFFSLTAFHNGFGLHTARAA